VTGQVLRAGVGIYLDGSLADEVQDRVLSTPRGPLGRFDHEDITRLDQLFDPARLATTPPPKSVFAEDTEVISSLTLALLDGVLRTTAFNSPVFPDLIPRRSQVDTGNDGP